MKSRIPRALAIAAAAFNLAAGLAAQGTSILQPPAFALTLPNYYMTPIGQVASLEGGAYVARTDDASSNWYNPAGLALADKSSVSSSAGTYQILSLVPTDLQSEDSGGSSQQVPALVGVVVKKLLHDQRFTLGFAGVRTNSWEQQTDVQIDELSLTPGRLLSYSADSQFRRSEFSGGVGYADGGPWRFGGTLAIANTNLHTNGSLAESIVESNGLSAGQASQRVSGSITQLRVTGGAQYQLTPEILLGAIARSPGVTLFRSADYSADAVASAGDASASFSFFDPKPRFDYKLPFQLVAGAALDRGRWELEVDVMFSTGTSSYDLFSSDQTGILILDDGQGGPPVVEQVPFGDVVSENRAVFNVAFGGSYALTENRVWALHFGFHTDYSPVGDADQFFSRVNLYSATLGVTGTVSGFTAALGFNYQFGDANEVPLAEVLQSDIAVDSLAIIYSVAYRF